MSESSDTGATRRVLLLAHAGRAAAHAVVLEFCTSLTAQGIAVRLMAEDAAALGLTPASFTPPLELTTSGDDAGRDCELTVVIGGDGTILRAAEVTRHSGTPILGINLGHVGFLAEAEPEDLELAVEAVVQGRYATEERMAIDVSVYHGKKLVHRTFALNEAAVEKASRQRMVDVVVGIDGRPVSRWGCDGVVCATPTGSTAYNFSAGGPIVWPTVEALLIVPISAHALFARAMVVAPSSVLAMELPDDTEPGVLWCDGRRMIELPPGARVEVRRSPTPVHLTRLRARPFTDRLVEKFALPVEGWRGAAERRRRENGDTDD
ncbi:MAG: NAD kinase [Nocardioides sp.]